MWIHSDFYLLSFDGESAIVMFKGQQLKLKSSLFDSRLEKFIQFFKENDFKVTAPASLNYSAEEASEIKNFFVRNNFGTTKIKPDVEENFLSYLYEENSFDFERVNSRILWYSSFSPKFNSALKKTLNFNQINDLGSLGFKDFCIVFVDPYNQDHLLDVARQLNKSNCHWLLVTIDYYNCYLGPIRTLPSSFCLQCVISRFVYNQNNSEQMRKMNLSHFSSNFEPPSFYINIINGYITSELIKFFTNDSSSLTGGVLEIGLIKPKTEFSRVLPFPNCDVCESQKC